MRERVVFDRMPPTPDRLVWCEWLRRHGINPSQVAVRYLERREDTYQIVYVTWEVVYSQVPRRRPNILTDWMPGDPLVTRVEEYDIVREMRPIEVAFQLEARPLPWPPVPPWPTKIDFDDENGRGYFCS